jgi:hypothetical protein
MSASWVPPRPTSHLRTFAISLLLIVLFLSAFLFCVEIEAVTPVSGVITARGIRDVRTVVAGLVEHTLHPGDELPRGATLATVRNDDLRNRLQLIEEQIRERESRSESIAALAVERDQLRSQLTQAVLHLPDNDGPWLVLEVQEAPLQAVRPGDVIAVVVPIDAETHRPRDLVARLDVDEKHWDSLAVGQGVRLRSAMYNHRLHGIAEARIERLEPSGEAAGHGERRFHALAPVTAAPFALPIGSSFQGDVVVGRKLVYRVILEH